MKRPYAEGKVVKYYSCSKKLGKVELDIRRHGGKKATNLVPL